MYVHIHINVHIHSVELVWVDHMNGSADGLRAVYDRIRGDFICMGSDMLSQYSLKDLSDLHRSRASDVTMLLVSAPTEEAEKKGAPKKVMMMMIFLLKITTWKRVS
jgi:NDP-sugar pyrophosphorylase family protein